MADSSLFHHNSFFSCSPKELYEWHARSGALERLIPPWENTQVINKSGGIEAGAEVEMRMHFGPVPFRWLAHHTENVPGQMFRDIQRKGPFARWSHTHTFTTHERGACLEDRIEYALPVHSRIPQVLRKKLADTLGRTFQHRQRVLEQDLLLHQQCSQQSMRVLISGASGVLGRALVPLLTTGGHQVFTLVRRKPDRQNNELYWNPMSSEIEELPAVDAVVHLAGEYIGVGRWTEEKKKVVVESRTRGTSLLAKVLANHPQPPKVFLSASAIGYYGDRRDVLTDENCSVGQDFISEVCRVWEEAAQPAAKADIRTVLMRIGVSLTPQGGALQRLLMTSPLGFLRRFCSGEQYISWISIDDTIAAMLHAMTCEDISGPLNISAPHPVTNAELMQTLARIMGRPLLIPMPASILKMIYGQMATEILLSGCRASCQKLQDSGFRFRHPTLEEALVALLGKYDVRD